MRKSPHVRASRPMPCLLATPTLNHGVRSMHLYIACGSHKVVLPEPRQPTRAFVS